MKKYESLNEELNNLESAKKRNFFQRNCRKISEGSLRLTIINIVLCGITGTFFWYPVIFRTYGIYPGFVIISLFVLLNYLMCYFVYYASNYSECNCYLTLVQRFLGHRWKQVAKFTYIMDYFAVYVIGFILSWNIFAYLLYYWGYIDPADVMDKKTLKFFDYNFKIVVLRCAVVGISYLVSVPLFLKEKMDNLKYIFLGFLTVISLNIIYLVFDLKQFRNHYIQNNEYSITDYKDLTLDSFRYVLIFMCAFYIQSNLLTMKTDTFNPTMPRMLKTIKISHLFFLGFALCFGFYGYYCLGDTYTSDLFMLRASFEGKEYEDIYRLILILMAVFYVLYMAFFNLSLRTFIDSNFDHKFSKYTISLVPLTVAALLTIAYPRIVDFLGYNALVVCLLNGFMFPIMIVIRIYKEERKSRSIIFSLYALIFLLLILSGISFVALVNDFLNSPETI
jgi:hypothetical protein